MQENSKKVQLAVKKIFSAREFALITMTILVAIIMGSIKPIFISTNNILNILLGLSTEAIIAAGMTVLMVSGNLDLSVGSTLALSGMLVSVLSNKGLPVGWVLILSVMSGFVVGFINGFILTTWNVNPFIITLGMMSVVRGGVLILSNGITAAALPESINKIGQGYAFKRIQYPIIFAVVIVVVLDTVLRKNRYFRQSYYVGSNVRAAEMTGIPVNKVKMINHMLVGILAAVAGILLTARMSGASTTVGVGIEAKVLSACVIGGVSMNGGEGTVIGAFFGSVLIGMIISALNIMGVDVYWQNVFSGLVLIVSVVIDSAMQDKQARSLI